MECPCATCSEICGLLDDEVCVARQEWLHSIDVAAELHREEYAEEINNILADYGY